MPKTVQKAKIKSVFNAKGSVTSPSILDAKKTNLDNLTRKSIGELRQRYKVLFGQDPPGALGLDLLRRSIAHRIQTNALGDISRQTQRLLDETIKRLATKPGDHPMIVPRRIKSGSELIKEWKGKTYRVVVTATGFSYAGTAYASLSEIASEITGTNWNGPRFFGLRPTINGSHANGR